MDVMLTSAAVVKRGSGRTRPGGCCLPAWSESAWWVLGSPGSSSAAACRRVAVCVRPSRRRSPVAASCRRRPFVRRPTQRRAFTVVSVFLPSDLNPASRGRRRAATDGRPPVPGRARATGPAVRSRRVPVLRYQPVEFQCPRAVCVLGTMARGARPGFRVSRVRPERSNAPSTSRPAVNRAPLRTPGLGAAEGSATGPSFGPCAIRGRWPRGRG